LRGFLLGVLATIVATAVCSYIVLSSGLVPANADAEPGWLEIWAADTSLEATLDREAPKGANPVALTDDNLVAGVEQGSASASPVAKGLYPQPPQLATDGVEDDPEGFSFWRIKHGIRWTGMPSWGNTLTDEQIWTIALFLKHMNKLPSAGEQAWQKVRN